MLAKRRCPHTGVLNFFCDREPFLAVGSITRAVQSKGCIWRSYVGNEAVGLSADMASAEARLTNLLLIATGDNTAGGAVHRRARARISATSGSSAR